MAGDAQFGVDGKGDSRIDALLCKWLAILRWVHCTDADRDVGYRYDLSILQAEFSPTQMFDAPGLGTGRSLRRRSTIRSLKHIKQPNTTRTPKT